MSAPRIARGTSHSAHVCAECELPFVQPEFGVQEGRHWRVFLCCLSCGWAGERLLDEKALDRFERELDAEREQIAVELENLTRSNMREYHRRFAAALAADAIQPEDF
jgi:hypothetical protein